MANRVLIGLQWGDEGKGKIIDVLTEQAHVVVRFQGGNNAGHTVEVGDQQFILHLVPSGVLRSDTLCVIGNGVVVNPVALHEEIEGLARRGVDILPRLFLSDRCQLVFRYHCIMDELKEMKLGRGKIGTTKRGIGPAYADKANRVGLRGADLCHPERLEQRFRKQAEFYNALFRDAGLETVDIDAEWQQLKTIAEKIAPRVADTTLLVNRAAESGKEILFEGAQGTWLDVDFGTYPFVTSSNTTVGGACTGSGLPPTRIDEIVGVAKAYTTRVGSGPLPTELDDEFGAQLRATGKEFGATTGRPRRCGWFDAVATRYAVMLNGVTDRLAVTKLDVLDDLETLRICTAYELDGERLEAMPADSEDLQRVTPVYEELPGWQAPTTEARSWEQLPENARAYLERIEQLIRARIHIVSVGPRRDQTFFVNR